MTYPYNNGLRDELFLYSDIFFGNLTEFFTHEELSDKLKPYNGERVVAIASQLRIPSHKTSLKDDLVGCIFYEGNSRGLVRACLAFENSSVEIAADKLVDVVSTSKIDPRSNAPHTYEFVTLGAGIPFEVVATDALVGYRTIINGENCTDMQLVLRSIDKIKSHRDGNQ